MHMSHATVQQQQIRWRVKSFVPLHQMGKPSAQSLLHSAVIVPRHRTNGKCTVFFFTKSTVIHNDHPRGDVFLSIIGNVV